MATRRQCRNRIKKRPLSERSEFGRFPISVLAACAVRVADRHRRVAFSCLLLLATQEKWVGCRAETRLVPTAVRSATLHPSATRSKSALRSATVVNVKVGFAANVSWRMKQCLCPAGRPSRGPARQPGHFFCFAKRSNQEKATPKMAPRYAGSPRRWHRNREASELAALRQRTLLYPISAPATWRHQRGFTATATANSKATATATATVAARSYKQRQLSLRGTSRATAKVAARA